MSAPRLERAIGQHPLAGNREELTKQLLQLDGTDAEQARYLLRELHLLRAQIVADAPVIASATEAYVPSFRAIADSIPDKTALIEFFLGPERFLTVFVLTSKRIALEVIHLGNLDLAQRVGQFRDELISEGGGNADGPRVVPGAAWESMASDRVHGAAADRAASRPSLRALRGFVVQVQCEGDWQNLFVRALCTHDSSFSRISANLLGPSAAAVATPQCSSARKSYG